MAKHRTHSAGGPSSSTPWQVVFAGYPWQDLCATKGHTRLTQKHSAGINLNTVNMCRFQIYRAGGASTCDSLQSHAQRYVLMRHL